MPHRDKSDSQGRHRSLLSLGDALRDEVTPAPSRLARAIADVRAEKDAVARHRPARARREGREAPRPSALNTAPASPRPASRQPAPDPPVPPISRSAPERPADKAGAPRAGHETGRARSAAAPASAASFDRGSEPAKAAPARRRPCRHGPRGPDRQRRQSNPPPSPMPARLRDSGGRLSIRSLCYPGSREPSG